MKHSPIKQLITDIIIEHIETLADTDRKRAKAAGIPHTLIGKMRKGSGMTLTTLEQIVNRFPVLSYRIAAVFQDNSTPVSKNTEYLIRRVPEFLEGDPEGDEKVRETTMWRIYHLQQDVLMREKVIADLRQRLAKAGIHYDTQHDLPVKDS